MIDRHRALDVLLRVVKLLGIPFTVMVYMMAIYGTYVYFGMGTLQVVFCLVVFLGMFSRLRRLIGMTRKKVLLLAEVEEKMERDDEEDDGRGQGFKRNNSIWESQQD
jgi:hypothetical protein